MCTFVLLFSLGCSKQLPSEKEYIEALLPEFSQDQIAEINYTLNISMACYTSIAKIRLKNKIYMAPLLKYKLLQKFSFYERTRADEIECIRLMFTDGSGNSRSPLPMWIDLNFTKPMELREIRKNRRFRLFLLNNESTIFYMIAGGRRPFYPQNTSPVQEETSNVETKK